MTDLFATPARRKHHESQASETTVWLTPPHILAALTRAPWGPFDLDPCAAPDRAGAPRPWPTARVHWVRGDGALLRRWFGRVFLNPPYGGPKVIGPWLDRMASHDRGVALIFARTETEVFFRAVWDQATAVLFLKGRVVFCRPDGTLPRHDQGGGQAGAPSVLVSYGFRDMDALAAAAEPDGGLSGKFVPLRLRGIVLLAALTAVADDSTGDPPSAPSGARSWRDHVAAAMRDLGNGGGTVSTDDLYRRFRDHPKASANRFWREKIRQTLQQGPFRRVRAGVWRLEKVGAA